MPLANIKFYVVAAAAAAPAAAAGIFANVVKSGYKLNIGLLDASLQRRWGNNLDTLRQKGIMTSDELATRYAF